MNLESFEAQGYVLVPEVLPKADCEAIAAMMRPQTMSGGTRCLLSEVWCATVAKNIRVNPQLATLLPDSYVAVQCTLFEKSTSRNWLVAIHQDLSIPVAQRVDEPSLRGWSEKEGQLFVQAPISLLEKLVAVRIHLDACSEQDGPLKVVPGSHTRGIISLAAAALARKVEREVTCQASLGAALVMRPLLLHASSKSKSERQRRVLHFVFGPRVLDHGLQWAHAV